MQCYIIYIRVYNVYIYVIIQFYCKHIDKNVNFFFFKYSIDLTWRNWSDVRDFDLVRITRAVHICTLSAICTILRPFSFPFCFLCIYLNTYNNSNTYLIIIIRMNSLYRHIYTNMHYCNGHLQSGVITCRCTFGLSEVKFVLCKHYYIDVHNAAVANVCILWTSFTFSGEQQIDKCSQNSFIL